MQRGRGRGALLALGLFAPVACRAIPNVEYVDDVADGLDASSATIDAATTDADRPAEPVDGAAPECTIFIAGDVCCGAKTCRGPACDCAACASACGTKTDTMCCATERGNGSTQASVKCKPVRSDCK